MGIILSFACFLQVAEKQKQYKLYREKYEAARKVNFCFIFGCFVISRINQCTDFLTIFTKRKISFLVNDTLYHNELVRGLWYHMLNQRKLKFQLYRQKRRNSWRPWGRKWYLQPVQCQHFLDLDYHYGTVFNSTFCFLWALTSYWFTWICWNNMLSNFTSLWPNLCQAPSCLWEYFVADHNAYYNWVVAVASQWLKVSVGSVYYL